MMAQAEEHGNQTFFHKPREREKQSCEPTRLCDVFSDAFDWKTLSPEKNILLQGVVCVPFGHYSNRHRTPSFQPLTHQLPVFNQIWERAKASYRQSNWQISRRTPIVRRRCYPKLGSWWAYSWHYPSAVDKKELQQWYVLPRPETIHNETHVLYATLGTKDF
jgi:hypothetical protein